ncbi:LPXTG cell wall anchor domain-containing protein [Enterococcus larvae]|uniref:LPXTG cell wall anchor domain-containing protein n=1 Tax=Enterococcus larvae TaxID=2794352 RepID=UPI003F328F20
MKRSIKFLLLLSMVCISFFAPINELNAEASPNSRTTITFDGWGDVPKPEPGEKGPQGSGTVAPPEEKSSGSFLKTGETINTSLSILGIVNVLSSVFLFWAIRRYQKTARAGGEAE